MTIRLATVVDADRVTDIARRAYEPYVARMGQVPAPMCDDFPALISEQRVFVLEDVDRVVGYCVLIRESDCLQLSNVAVDPVAHGRGFGRALVSFAEAKARDYGYPRIELYTNIHMTENQRFYPALGYAEFDRREESGFSRIYYRKQLR